MAVRLAITAAILIYLATQIDMAEAARATAAISPPHLLVVLALVGLDRAVMILRWVLLLRAAGNPITGGAAARLFLVSSFVGSFLPAGVGGDAARAYGLAQENTSASDAVASVAVDRLLGVQSLVLMAFVGLLIWPTNQRPWHLPALVGAAAVGCVSLLWADVWVRFLIPARRHEGFIARRLLRLTDAVGRYRGHRGVLFHVFGWSIAVQVLRVTQAYVLGLGLGMTVPFTYFLLFMPLALLLLLLPISVSGFGLPQGGIVWMLDPMNVPHSVSFALSTLIVLTGLAGNLPGLFLWLRARNPVKSRV
jgi:uncharacterized membrane protein YbhN (UPF0104 family)